MFTYNSPSYLGDPSGLVPLACESLRLGWTTRGDFVSGKEGRGESFYTHTVAALSIIASQMSALDE